MEKFGFTLFVLFGLLGAVAAFLKAIEMMNERREKILDAESKLTICHRHLMLTSDWKPIRQITFLFVYLVAGLLILSAPMHAALWFAELAPPTAEHRSVADEVVVAQSVLALIIGVVIIIAAILSRPGFNADEIMMSTHIDSLKNSIVGKWKHAEGGILDFKEAEAENKSYKVLTYTPSHWRHEGDKTAPSSEEKGDKTARNLDGRYKVVDYKTIEMSSFGETGRQEAESVAYEISAGKLILSGGYTWKFDRTEFTKQKYDIAVFSTVPEPRGGHAPK